jgi:hypothetical protein
MRMCKKYTYPHHACIRTVAHGVHAHACIYVYVSNTSARVFQVRAKNVRVHTCVHVCMRVRMKFQRTMI